MLATEELDRSDIISHTTQGDSVPRMSTQAQCSGGVTGLVLLQSAGSVQPDDIAGDTKMLESGGNTQALLRLNVRWVRLLIVTATVGIVMTIVLLLCSAGGLTLSTKHGNLTDGEQKLLLDTYNSVSGAMVSAMLAPIEAVLAMLAAVASLTFLSEITLQRGLQSYCVAMAMGTAVSFLVTNGLSALNVQLVPGDVIATITSADLSLTTDVVDYQPASATNGSLLTTWDQ
ncbi:hypothetical protein PHYBOEH_003983 [Phytophthora boehmeriae]|uniref:Uncharacterized protein n=1 Tax=Phytophthora boehmeriae TaxID=109152 RepID=A0A8T1WPD6_9STRA|nr:hypothetical protein PHYBOEH_003983 [Phytophthora boehmeriae]